MAYEFVLDLIENNKGVLSLCDGTLPFAIKRFYFLTDNKDTRAECKHKNSEQALFCTHGSCNVFVQNETIQNYVLQTPNKGIIIEKNDWHRIDNFSEDCVLVVLSSSVYDAEDYYHEK